MIRGIVMENLFSVHDRIVLITGSTRGLGLALAEGFAGAGAVVVVNGRGEASTEAVAGRLREAGGRALAAAFDVTDAAAVAAAVERIENQAGPIDVLINNAGIHRRAPLAEMTLEFFDEVLEVNLKSVFVISQQVARRMIARGRGRIINITSLNAEGARPTIGNYCAAKGGLKMLTKSMATEWGRFNIQTNAIGPGYFKTELTAALREQPEFDAWVKSEVPLGRWGEPGELLGAAIFLASGAASYINGHTIYVDGGWQACL